MDAKMSFLNELKKRRAEAVADGLSKRVEDDQFHIDAFKSELENYVSEGNISDFCVPNSSCFEGQEFERSSYHLLILIKYMEENGISFWLDGISDEPTEIWVHSETWM